MDSRRRSIVKALSWRVLGAAITTVVTYFVTGALTAAALVGAIDTVIKLAAYYGHERAWNKIRFGTARPPEYQI